MHCMKHAYMYMFIWYELHDTHTHTYIHISTYPLHTRPIRSNLTQSKPSIPSSIHHHHHHHRQYTMQTKTSQCIRI